MPEIGPLEPTSQCRRTGIRQDGYADDVMLLTLAPRTESSASRSCSETDAFRPEGTAVFVTSESMASGALSASVRPFRAAKPYSAGVPTT